MSLQWPIRPAKPDRSLTAIGGQRRWPDVTNPATGKLIARVGIVGAAETERAIAAADKAMQTWKARPAKERADILRQWYKLIMANQEDLAIIMTAEQGKVLAESRG